MKRQTSKAKSAEPTLLQRSLSRELSAQSEDESYDDLQADSLELNEAAQEINRVIAPPRKLTGEDIHVRSLLLVSDEVNKYGGQFEARELEDIARLVVDAPALVGHRKDRLPIGRIFQAEVIERQGSLWVKAQFFWLRESQGSESLKTNIDGGVYKECSLGFTFSKAECAECGADVRLCNHAMPNKDEQAALFLYRGIRSVLEVSLVYRGAVPGTRVGLEFGFEEQKVGGGSNAELQSPAFVSAARDKSWLTEMQLRRICLSGTRINSLTNSESLKNVVIKRPLYDGLALLIGRRKGEPLVLRDDGAPAPPEIVKALSGFSDITEDDFLIYGRLVGKRGKQRRSVGELIRWLKDDGGSVRSVTFKALALLRRNSEWLNRENSVSFAEALRNYCSDSALLSYSQPESSPLATNTADSESLEIVKPGEYTVYRKFLEPRALAVVSAENTCELIAESAEGVTVITVEASLRGAKSGETVSMRWERVAERNGKLTLINPRLLTRLGTLQSPDDAVILADGPDSSNVCRTAPLLIAGTHFKVALAKGGQALCAAPASFSASAGTLISLRLVKKTDYSERQFATAPVVSGVCNLSSGDGPKVLARLVTVIGEAGRCPALVIQGGVNG